MLCLTDVSLTGGVCPIYDCERFVELSGTNFQIPPRSPQGICYYTKLFDAQPNAPSFGPKLSTVLSRNHDINSPEQGTAPPASPYIMGQKAFQIRIDGPRAVKLSGSRSRLAPILVDNYFLVGSREVGQPASGYLAYGTDDAAVIGTHNILVNNVPVPLIGFGPLGTATVNALLLNERFTPGKNYLFSVDALDCGGIRELSEVYLIFQ